MRQIVFACALVACSHPPAAPTTPTEPPPSNVRVVDRPADDLEMDESSSTPAAPRAPTPAPAPTAVQGKRTWFCASFTGWSVCATTAGDCQQRAGEAAYDADLDAPPACAQVDDVWCGDHHDGTELENPYECFLTHDECASKGRTDCSQVRAAR